MRFHKSTASEPECESEQFPDVSLSRNLHHLSASPFPTNTIKSETCVRTLVKTMIKFDNMVYFTIILHYIVYMFSKSRIIMLIFNSYSSWPINLIFNGDIIKYSLQQP